jgi:hypothetical protein
MLSSLLHGECRRLRPRLVRDVPIDLDASTVPSTLQAWPSTTSTAETKCVRHETGGH